MEKREIYRWKKKDSVTTFCNSFQKCIKEKETITRWTGAFFNPEKRTLAASSESAAYVRRTVANKISSFLQIRGLHQKKISRRTVSRNISSCLRIRGLRQKKIRRRTVSKTLAASSESAAYATLQENTYAILQMTDTE